ncbi:hypothetical protein [Microcystis phage Mel-JY01]
MIKLMSLVTETISDRVWHVTQPGSAVGILRSNDFMLTYNPKIKGNGPNVKKYTMSVARTPYGGFYSNMGGRSAGYRVMFELDGRKLSHRYSGKAFNDFGSAVNMDDDMQDEMEDVVISNKDYIPNAIQYIRSIHLLLFMPTIKFKKNQDGENELLVDMTSIAEVILHGSKNKIPIYYYDTETRFRSARGGKVLEIQSDRIKIIEWLKQYYNIKNIKVSDF